MSRQTIILYLIIAANIAALCVYIYARFMLRRARQRLQKRLYILHNAIPVFSGTVRHNGKSYQITNFAKTCYVIQSPEPPVSLQKTNGVLDVDKGRVDSTLVLIRLDIEAQPIEAILTFIKKNY